MKRGLTISWILFLLCTFLAQANILMAQGIKRNNLVRNPGFEEGASSWNLKNAAKIVSTEAHSGKNSLYYANPNPGTYNLFTQGIPVRPGQKLFFRVWVKGKNITTANLWAEKGAGIFIQGYDARNKYIKGAFPFGLTGTFDWTELKGIYEVPENVTHISIGLYMRRQTTGTVWFDDIAVKAVNQPAFKAYLQFPNYRACTMGYNDHPWEMLIISQLSSEWGKSKLKSTILDGEGRVLHEETTSIVPSGSPIMLSWKSSHKLNPGQYNWRMILTSSNGKEQKRQEIPVTVDYQSPAVYIDRQGFTVINGKRFFPLGIYLGKGPKQGNWASSPKNLSRISKAGFNTILSYYYGDRKDAVDYIKSASENQLYVIYNLADVYNGGPNYTKINTPASQISASLINKLKKEPNLLAWYTVDELGSGEVFSVENRYKQIVKLDPNHPVFEMNNKLEVLPIFYNTTDIWGTDPYPVSGNNFSSLAQVSTWTRSAVDSGYDIKPVWQALQIFDKRYAKSSLPSHPPSLREMKNMSYQALIQGAKGLVYYAYHWLWYGENKDGKKIYSEKNFLAQWPKVVEMLKEIKSAVPYILAGNEVNLELLSRSGAVYNTWQKDNKMMLILANPGKKEEHLSLSIPVGWKLSDNNLKGERIQFKNKTLNVYLSPFSSGTLFFTK